MLVVDLLHEFELGVWRALLVHLLRILHAMDLGSVHELDRRYVISFQYVARIPLMRVTGIAKSQGLVQAAE